MKKKNISKNLKKLAEKISEKMFRRKMEWHICLMHYKQKSQEKGRQFALKNLEQKVYEKL